MEPFFMHIFGHQRCILRNWWKHEAVHEDHNNKSEEEHKQNLSIWSMHFLKGIQEHHFRHNTSCSFPRFVHCLFLILWVTINLFQITNKNSQWQYITVAFEVSSLWPAPLSRFSDFFLSMHIASLPKVKAKDTTAYNMLEKISHPIKYWVLNTCFTCQLFICNITNK